MASRGHHHCYIVAKEPRRTESRRWKSRGGRILFFGSVSCVVRRSFCPARARHLETRDESEPYYRALSLSSLRTEKTCTHALRVLLPQIRPGGVACVAGRLAVLGTSTARLLRCSVCRRRKVAAISGWLGGRTVWLLSSSTTGWR